MIYFVIPVYNEEENLQAMIRDVRAHTQGHAYKMIAVNDGSTDNSLKILQNFQQGDLEVVSSYINMNIGAVFTAGILRALEIAGDEDILIIMESDQTNAVDLIKDIIREIEADGHDVVIASRYQQGGGYKNFPFTRKIFSYCANYFLRKMFPIKPNVFDYTIFMRGYRVRIFREAIKYFGARGLIQSQGFIANSELLIKAALFTKKISEVPLIYDYGRKKGKSKMNIARTINEYFVFTRYMKNLISEMAAQGFLVS